MIAERCSERGVESLKTVSLLFWWCKRSGWEKREVNCLLVRTQGQGDGNHCHGEVAGTARRPRTYMANCPRVHTDSSPRYVTTLGQAWLVPTVKASNTSDNPPSPCLASPRSRALSDGTKGDPSWSSVARRASTRNERTSAGTIRPREKAPLRGSCSSHADRPDKPKSIAFPFLLTVDSALSRAST